MRETKSRVVGSLEAPIETQITVKTGGASEVLYTSLVYAVFTPAAKSAGIKIDMHPDRGPVPGKWCRTPLTADDHQSYETWTCARSYASGDATPYGGWFG